MASKPKSTLTPLTRDICDAFYEMLLNDLKKNHPRSHKLIRTVEDAKKRVEDREFGKDLGGAIN